MQTSASYSSCILSEVILGPIIFCKKILFLFPIWWSWLKPRTNYDECKIFSTAVLTLNFQFWPWHLTIEQWNLAQMLNTCTGSWVLDHMCYNMYITVLILQICQTDFWHFAATENRKNKTYCFSSATVQSVLRFTLYNRDSVTRCGYRADELVTRWSVYAPHQTA